jgi:hypothetical protein
MFRGDDGVGKEGQSAKDQPKYRRKWKKREAVEDLPTGPKEATSTVLTIEDEARSPHRHPSSQPLASEVGGRVKPPFAPPNSQDYHCTPRNDAANDLKQT